MDSWFEVGDEVDAALTGNRATRKKREALIIEKVLEPRREWWTQEAAWAAYILYQPEVTKGGRNFMQQHWPWSRSAHFMKSP
jgi:hypothetical protein